MGHCWPGKIPRYHQCSLQAQRRRPRVYDVTSRESFEELETWIESLIGNADANVKVMLVGNKVDKVRQNAANRQVDIAEGQQLAEQYGFMFVETSAFADENVTTAFEELLNTVVEHKLQVGDNLE